MNKTTTGIIAAIAAIAAAGAVSADTIDFGQFGPELTNVSTPATGFTKDGVGFTLVGPGPFLRDDEGSDYVGDFPLGDKTLFEQTPGQAIIYFATPISSIGTLYVAPDFYGEAYTATMTAYDNGGHVLGAVSYNDTVVYNPGANPGFEIIGAGIDHITLATNDAKHGFNIAGYVAPAAVAGAPEPAAWALMLVGFGGLGARLRARRGMSPAI